jgi:hypothetical protein
MGIGQPGRMSRPFPICKGNATMAHNLRSKFRTVALAAIAIAAALNPVGMVTTAASRVFDALTGILTSPVQRFGVLGANTLTGLIPTLYEALDVVSRELIGMIPAVSRDSTVDRAAKGQTVMSFATPAVTASDVTPGVTAPNDGDQAIGNIPITISKSRYVPIRWNGEEQRGMNAGGPGLMNIMRDQFSQAFRTLANEVEVDLATTARLAASRAFGTAGTTPFGTNGDLSDFAGVRQILEDNGAPTSALRYVAGSAAMANLRGKQAVLFRVNEAGTDQLLRDGILGQVEGMMVGNSAAIKTAAITKGTGAAYTSNTAGYAIGATAITLITGTGTVLAGDVVTFAGDSNKYVVAAGVVAPGVITLAAPGLRQALPASAVAMTIGNNFVPNMAFAKTGIVLATRLPATPVDASGRPIDMADDRTTIIDPVSGLAFEVSLYTQYRQLKYEVALAWGQAGVKPEHIALGLG